MSDTSYLTQKQIDQILRPINPARVSSRDGQSYVQAYDDRAMMARIYGVARWSSDVVEMVLLFEREVTTKAGKPAWHVGYRAGVRVTVNAPDGTQLATYTEYHAGASTHPDLGEAHGGAITNAESYAFKRCCVMALLDQGGLSLYGGKKEALVLKTLHYPFGDAEPKTEKPVDSHVQEIADERDQDIRPSETVDPRPDPRTTSARPVKANDPAPVKASVAELQEKIARIQSRGKPA